MSITENSNENALPRRQVRSFVKRAGRMTPSQSRALKELWPRYGIADFAATPLAAAFQESAPLVLEIGFGNGETLVQQAAENPGNNYLGIEVHEPGIGHCLLLAEAEALTNLRVINADALEILRDYVRPKPCSESTCISQILGQRNATTSAAS